MMKMVSSASPPRVSATTGMKSTPAELQAERCCVSLRRTPTCRAWPGVEAAPCKVSCCRGEITWTSNAAGQPRLQVGRSMSAGLEWESWTRLGASLVGAKAADRAAENRTSRMALWNGGLENGADLRVNERQKIRHYRARSTEERRRRRRRRRNSDFLLRAARTQHCAI